MDERDDIERQVDACVHAVDLDIAYTPVLDRPGSTQPVEVAREGDGAFSLVWRNALSGAEYREPVEVEALRLMRARYLVTRGEVFRSLNVVSPEQRAHDAQTFNIPFAPEPGSPMAKRLGMRGEETAEELIAEVARLIGCATGRSGR